MMIAFRPEGLTFASLLQGFMPVNCSMLGGSFEARLAWDGAMVGGRSSKTKDSLKMIGSRLDGVRKGSDVEEIQDADGVEVRTTPQHSSGEVCWMNGIINSPEQDSSQLVIWKRRSMI